VLFCDVPNCTENIDVMQHLCSARCFCQFGRLSIPARPPANQFNSSPTIASTRPDDDAIRHVASNLMPDRVSTSDKEEHGSWIMPSCFSLVNVWLTVSIFRPR